MPVGPERQAAAAAARKSASAEGRNAENNRAVESAARIDGRPWWESDLRQYVARYTDVGLLNAEAQIAALFGWHIAETTGMGGHRSVGAMAMGAFLLGLPGMALASGRSADSITVTWRRESEHLGANGEAMPEALSLLRQLKAMLEESLITESEYEAKKQELLQRM